ncbi:hypothetical protein EI94DRAFT_1788017 [Lactarius quietus]|nr:hypothetical protein EI94DRAFT_1788017 [Lactarius quietus]
MPPKLKTPLYMLKRGLSRLKKHYEAKKKVLTAKWQSLTAEEEHWLDHEGNLVDEQRVLDTLEAASDYECTVSQLDDAGKALVKKLREEAGDVPKVVGAKQKLLEHKPREPQPKKKKEAEPNGPIHKWIAYTVLFIDSFTWKWRLVFKIRKLLIF